MGEGNLERARQGYEVLNRGEVDRFVSEFTHPDYEFHTGVEVPSIPSVVRGHDELRDWIQHWYADPWEGQLQMEVERIEELDDGRVVALLTLRARGRESGVAVDTEYAHILPFRKASVSASTGSRRGSELSWPPAWLSSGPMPACEVQGAGLAGRFRLLSVGGRRSTPAFSDANADRAGWLPTAEVGARNTAPSDRAGRPSRAALSFS